MVTHTSISSILEVYKSEDKRQSLIIDLRGEEHFIVYPVQQSYEQCHCSETPADIISHCSLCGATDVNLKSGVPTYELYSTVYKALDIFSRHFESVSFISKQFIPIDFVGSLNRMSYSYIDGLPYRRNILHITNDIVHSDCLFVESGEAKVTKDTLTHITIFSSEKEVNNYLKKKYVHSSGQEPLDYLNMLLSQSGITDSYLLS